LAAVVSGPPKDTVTLVDTTFGGINWVRSLPGEPSAAPTSASDGTSFWIVNPNAHALERLDPAYGRIVMSIPLPRPGARGGSNASYNGVAAGQGPVWVTGNETAHVLWRVDPPSRHVKAIRLPFAPGQVAVGGDGVWVVDSRGGTVLRVDPQ